MHTQLTDELAQLDNIDINQFLSLTARVKSGYPELETQRTRDEVAKIWYDSGIYLRNEGNNKTAELCFFLAHVYNRENIDYLVNLIQSYAANGKYKEAVEFLPKLYKASASDKIPVFWETLVGILPMDQINKTLISSNNSLELVIADLGLDDMDTLTWLCLGYTLKANDYPILANQALENAIALKYIEQ